MIRLYLRSVATLNFKPSKGPLQKSPLLTDDVTVVPFSKTYEVVRRASGDLPIYTDIKKAGTKTHTLIRKVNGSCDDLIRDLSVMIPENRIWKSFSGVGINGRYKSIICKWLTHHNQ
jgi:hypothetical protein